jgi:hypothetical protein
MSKVKKIASAFKCSDSMVAALGGVTEKTLMTVDSDQSLALQPEATEEQKRAFLTIMHLNQLVDFTVENSCEELLWAILHQELSDERFADQISYRVGRQKGPIGQEMMELALGRIRKEIAYDEFARAMYRATGRRIKWHPDGIEVGDKVVCVDSEETCSLEEGETYTISSVDWVEMKGAPHLGHFLYKMVGLQEVDGVQYESARFKKVEDNEEID